MSRHYLLDGYNLIKQVPRLADLSLRDGREALVHWINTCQPQGSARNLVTIVFDGNPEHFGNMKSGAVKVIFTDYQSADDFIKAVIDQAKDKKKFTVVSNDKGITMYVRAQGAQILAVKEFAADFFAIKKNTARGQVKKESKTAAKYISETQASKINKEFEKIWLK